MGTIVYALKLGAGPEGVLAANTVVELADDQAQQWLADGAARLATTAEIRAFMTSRGDLGMDVPIERRKQT